MSFTSGQHHQAFENTWVSNNGAVQVGATSMELVPQAIGFFNVDANCETDAVSLSMPNIKKTKRIKIKMGRVKSASNNEGVGRRTNNPIETIPFGANQIVSFSGKKSEVPNKYNWKQQKIALGYDGFNAKKSLTSKLDATPLLITFILQGDPVQRYFGQNQVSYEFALNKEMCTACGDCYDDCGKVSCKTIIESLKKSMAFPLPKTLNSGATVRRPITDFIKLNTLTKCNPAIVAPAPVLADFKKWSITICDDGATTLGQLAVQFPALNLFADGRQDGVSTYSAWLPAADLAPADFTVTKHSQPICDTCPTCPEAYTKSPALRNVQVTVECGASAPVIPGAITTTKISGSLAAGDTYLITLPIATTDAVIEAALVGCVEFTILADTVALCTGTAVSFPWVSCDTCQKAEKEYRIILNDKDCPTADQLADLQAEYPGLVITIDQAADCLHTYKTKVLSSCVKAEEDCLPLETSYSFKAPHSFKGKLWSDDVTPIILTPDCTVPAESTDCCVCGIIVEGKAFHKDTMAECVPGLFDYNPGDLLGVKVHVTIQQYDPTGVACDVSKEYITILQDEKIPSVTSGTQVQKHERGRLAYEQALYSGNLVFDAANGFSLTAKPHFFYDVYRLVLKSKLNYNENGLMYGVDDIAYNFYFASGTGKSFENHINSLILSAGNPELTAVVL